MTARLRAPPARQDLGGEATGGIALEPGEDGLDRWPIGRGGREGRDEERLEARVDAGDDDSFYLAKVITARFYADHLLTQAEGLASTVVDGSGAVLAMPLDQY